MMHRRRVQRGLAGVTRQRSAWTTRWRFASAALFGASLFVTMVPTGCAAVADVPAVPEQPLPRPIPPTTVAAFEACAIDAVDRLERHSYEVSFKATIQNDSVRKVETRGPQLADSTLESCMIQALKAMPTASLTAVDVTPDPWVSQRILPNVPHVLGNVTTVLPQVVELAPLVLTPQGITIIVVVAIIVLAATIADDLTDCDKEWEEAVKRCEDELAKPNPSRRITGGHTQPKDCARGLVSELCGGNPVDWGDQPARPGRRT